MSRTDKYLSDFRDKIDTLYKNYNAIKLKTVQSQQK